MVPLNAVFHFQNERPSTVQDRSACLPLVKAVEDVVATILKANGANKDASVKTVTRRLRSRLHLDPLVQDRKTPVGSFSEADCGFLKQGLKQLRPLTMYDEPKRGAVWTEEWFPQYAAALQMECVGVGTLQARLVALDGWNRVLHFPDDGGSFQSAVSTTHTVIYCGKLDVEHRLAFMDALYVEIAEASKRTGSNRSAANKETPGHQKTPPFLASLVRNAVDAQKKTQGIATKHLPSGGMTDVGKHTGGEPRDTCWGIVRAVFDQSLPANGSLYKRFEVELFSKLLEKEIQAIRSIFDAAPTTVPVPVSAWKPLNQCFQVLDCIVERAFELGSDGHDISRVDEKCRQWRLNLDAKAQHWNDHRARCYPLATNSAMALMAQANVMTHPLQAPERFDFSSTSGASTGLRESVLRNASQYEFTKPRAFDVDAILKVVKDADTAKSIPKTLNTLRTIEVFLCDASEMLQGKKQRGGTTLTCYGYYLVLKWYTDNVGTLARLPNYDEVARVKMQSQTVLLSFVTCCLVHALASKEYPQLKEYKIALDWKRLEVCVQDEAASRQALLHVAYYIRSVNAAASGPPVFDLGDHDGTRRFARQISKTLATHVSAYDEVIEAWESHIDAVWSTIQTRKTQVANARREIKEYQAQAQVYEEAVAEESERLAELREEDRENGITSNRYDSSYILRDHRQQLHRCRSAIAQRKRLVKELVQMPEFLVSPLPENRDDALEVVFYLKVPYNLEVVAELCGRAQRTLGAADMSVSQEIMVERQSKISWAEYVMGRKGMSTFKVEQRFLKQFPTALEVPKSHGQTTIDRVGSRESFVKSCAWYPSVTDTQVVWADHNGVDVNPSAIKVDVSRAFFTAKVPVIEGDSVNYQWANAYPGGTARSNIPYAKADDAGEAIRDFRAFSSLGAIRAFPLQQLRKVFAAVEGDTLEWSNSVVDTVIQQAVFQVGELSDEAIPKFVWSGELRQFQARQEFHASMLQLISDVRASPRRWNSIPLLAKLAGFLCELTTPAKSPRWELAATARAWAVETREERLKGVPTAERVELRARECLLYGYALLSFRLGRQATDTEAQEMCELLVLFHNSYLFAGGSSLQTLVRKVEAEVQVIIAGRVTDLAVYLSKNAPKISSLCQLVNSRVPSTLNWTCVPVSKDGGGFISSCFEATDESDGRHYLLNLFTGSLLIDGAPPGGLPRELRAMAKYVKMFGDQDFEVASSRNAIFESVQPFHGYLYRFQVLSGELMVEESDSAGSSSSLSSLQTCRAEWISIFANVFPARLVELYSHWYWPAKSCVLLRPWDIKKKQVMFVVKLSVFNLAGCFQVPRADWTLPFGEVVSRARKETYRAFIVPNSELKNTFVKFEETKFTHFLKAPSGVVEIELPRYGIRFVQTDFRTNRIASVEFDGYILASGQQLNDQMCRFRRYLVLENATNDCASAQRKLLVPVGNVYEHVGNGTVDITLPSQASATIATTAFDEHNRMLVLTAETIESRLQLAALYAVSGDWLPFVALKMTGGEAALEVLRGCSSSRPFSAEAKEHLLTVRKYGSRHTPVLALMVSHLLRKSNRLGFLLQNDESVEDTIDVNAELDQLTVAATSKVPVNTLRQSLTVAEEWDFLGPDSILHRNELVWQQCAQPVVEMDDIPVKKEFTRDEEKKLLALVANKRSGIKLPGFPLSQHRSNKTSIGIMGELEESWTSHHQHPDGQLKCSTADMRVAVQASHLRVVEKRELLLQYLLDSVSRAQQGWRERLLTRVNRLPSMTIADIMRSVLDDDVLLNFAPRFSKQSRLRFKEAALLFMDICVLEDKLERIISRAQLKLPPPAEYFVEELACVRQWSPEEHPYWLVFEVEGRVQIRPEQYVIARHLIENPGSICQLNMGRGKTRVILPMLFLYYRYNVTDRVVRTHFLSPLLSETRQFMHRVLSSGTLRLPFVELPFNRSVELDLRSVMLMQEAVDEAKETGGLLIIAPEHRLSLELKRLELESSDVENKDEICDALDELMDPQQYIDIFDESDALLHHKYHLVYAVGTPMLLDGGSSRWLAAQALLRVLTSTKSSRVREVLKQSPDLFCVQPEYNERCGAFDGFRLNAAIEGTVKARLSLKKALLEDLIDHSPFEMVWLKAIAQRDVATRALLIQAICDSSVAADAIAKLLPVGIEGAKQQLLSLRGLLAYGVLESCLEKRNRVTFGLPDPGTRTKSLAIPFTAADLPAERSEFSHPDVSITLTLVAYYHAGLTDKDIRKSLEMMLRLDYSERNRLYDEWFNSIEDQVDARHRDMLSKLDHISLDNAHQFAIVCNAFRYSMEMINFFLNRLVFPRDTKQYPERLSRSAWDLVRGPTNIGFSGTNDTHRLLPVAVSQREPNEPSLRGTNGKMIDLLLTSTVGYEVLSDWQPESEPVGAITNITATTTSSSSKAMWQILLLHALAKKCLALIDTGALLAGVAIDEAARFLIQDGTLEAAGVTYYDTRKEFDCWVVLERERQVLRPLKTSSLHERDTFVIFDEARSRGSDMKLRADAVAMLTLGPAITKDKLMQGAGRMRQLGRNQKLWLTSMNEVKNSITQLKNAPGSVLTLLTTQTKAKTKSTTIGLVDVLNWVVENTQQQCTLGLLEWAQNGLQFGAKEADVKNELQADDWRLESQYNAAQTDELIYDIIRERMDRVVERNFVEDKVEQVFDRIDDRAFTYGYEDEVHVSSYGEECERELQVEEEEEVHAEERGPELRPAAETPWDTSRILSFPSLKNIKQTDVSFISMRDAVAKWIHPADCATNIAWGLMNVFTTTNFWTTVVPPVSTASAQSKMVWNGYLRLIDTLVLYEDGTILALTDLEADSLLLSLTKLASGYPSRASVVNLSFACAALSKHGREATTENTPLAISSPRFFGARQALPVTAIIGCCLFNGDTQFVSSTQEALVRKALKELLSRLRQREQRLQEFIEARRFPQRWTRSFLHQIAKEMDLDDL